MSKELIRKTDRILAGVTAVTLVTGAVAFVFDVALHIFFDDVLGSKEQP